MSRVRWLPLIAAVLLPGPGCERGPEVTTLTVTARDSTGAPVAGVPVRLAWDDDQTDSTSAAASTGAEGRVRFSLPAGGTAAVGIGASDWGRLEIIWVPLLLDPGETVLDVRLPGSDGRPVVTFADPETRAARWGLALYRLRQAERLHYEAYQDWVAAGQPGPLAVDVGALAERTRAALAGESDREVRAANRLALMSMASTGDAAPDSLYGRALEEIGPTARIWSRRPEDLRLIRYAALRAEGGGRRAEPAGRPGPAVEAAGSREGSGAPEGPEASEVEAAVGRRVLADRRADEYLRRVAASHPSARARAAALGERMEIAREGGRLDDARALYRVLESEYPSTPAYARARLSPPGVAVERGGAVPDVAFPPLDVDAPPLRPSDLAGRVWLVDFWATWCVPCVAEMPVLHRAYARYRERGFEIVSVSFDASREAVASFREEWPMPWRHAFAGSDALGGSALSTRYGVVGIPRAVLVGRDGTVLAIDEGLRGDALEATLDRVMAGGATRRDSGR